MAKSEKPKTQFEQIPLKIVKQIAKEDIQEEGTNGNDTNVETPKKP